MQLLYALRIYKIIKQDITLNLLGPPALVAWLAGHRVKVNFTNKQVFVA